MEKVSVRYAQALLEIAQEKNRLSEYQSQLKECMDIIQSNKLVYTILSAPENPRSAKVGVLEKLFGKCISQDVFNLLKLLIDKTRLDMLGDIYKDYQNSMRNLTHGLDVTAISAFPLDESEIESIKVKFKKQYNVSWVNVEVEIDESLLGGVKFMIGNEMIDNSMKSMIESMEDQVKVR